MIGLVSFGILVVGLLVQLLATIALFLWGRRVAQWHPHVAWRWLVFLPFLGLAFALIGFGLTSASLVSGFERVATVAPAEKAALLSDEIARSMTFTWLFLPFAAVAYLTSIVVSFIGTVTRSSAPAAPPR